MIHKKIPLENSHIIGHISTNKHVHSCMYVYTVCMCVFVYIIYSLGVSCPRAGSNNTERQRQQPPAEPYGQEAMNFTKELILQREVDVEVENCDKGGNFIGWMFVDGRNLAVSLVEVTPSLTINNYQCVWVVHYLQYVCTSIVAEILANFKF